MTSNYYSKFSRSRNLLKLAIGSPNNSTQNEELDYENEEYDNAETPSPLPFGASEILENCSLSFLKEIGFEDDHQENETCIVESPALALSDDIVVSNSPQTQPVIDTHEEEINSNLLLNPTATQEKHNELQASFSLNITNNQLSDNISDSSIEQSPQDIDNTNNMDTRDVNTPMPSSDYDSFGEDQPVPSVQSLLTDPSASSPVSQNYSSGDVSTPLASRKRKLTKKKDSGRLREKFHHEWIDSKRKRLKNTGEAYKSRNGKLRDKKAIIYCDPCPSTCKLKCFEKLDDDTRCGIFNNFWAIGDHSQQYNFIVNYVVKINKKRSITQGQSRRSYTYVYHLPLTQNNQATKLVVCKSMFLNTVSCGPKMIRTAMKKSADTSSFALVDNRGRHDHHKTSINEEMIKSVLDHVNSFEPVESHYCRKDSNKVYLDGSLNFIRMYNLYKEWYDPTKYGTKCESLRQYRDIVNKRINLSFHRPKKDQCSVCHAFKNGPVTAESKATFENHIKNKNLTRSLKEKDKRDSQNDAKIFCASFDLQKVLLSPSGEVSLFYYCQRLKVHNLSIFSMGNLAGTCYLWNEQIAMKGSNEVASCVYDTMKLKRSEGCDDFRFWSDNCTGQNRNRIMFFMYLFAAKELNINIKHTFLEKGHTQNEGDSIHATIEKAAKYKTIYTPSEWSSLIRWAKTKGTPYNVIDVTQNMIYDFKKMQANACFNWTKNSAGEKIMWSKIKQVRVSSHDTYVLYYKYDLSEDAVECHIKIVNPPVRTRRQITDRSTEIPLQLCYNRLLPIQPSKKKALLDLCRKNIIPPVYHGYYESLVASNDVILMDESDNED